MRTRTTGLGLLVLFFLLATAGAAGQANRVTAWAQRAPLDTLYWDQLDEWGWAQYYTQNWDSMALVFEIAERRSRPGVPGDSLQHQINLLSRIRVGQARAERGELHAGIAAMQSALREGETHFGPILEWSFYHVAVALIYEKVGNENQAIIAHQQASRIVAAAIKKGEANYFLRGNKEGNLGRIYADCNRYPEAVIHFQRAIAAYHEAGVSGLIRMSDSYTKLAVVLARQGKFAEANAQLEYLENMPARYRTDWLTQATRGRVESIRGNEPAALAAYRRALSYGPAFIQPQHPFPTHRPRTFLAIRREFAEYLIQRGRYTEARTVLAEADGIAQDFMPGDPEYHHPIWLLQAKLALTRGEVAVALGKTEQLVAAILGASDYRWRDPIVRRAGIESPYFAAVLDLQAQALYARYRDGAPDVDRELVLANCAAGQAVIADILLSHTSEFKYSQLLERYRALYDLPVRLATERWRTDSSAAARAELFQAMEQAKSYDLSTTLRLRRAAADGGAGLRQLIATQRAVQARMRDLERRLIDQLSPGDAQTAATALQLQLRDAQWELDSLTGELDRRHPDYAALQRQTKRSCRLTELQAALRPGEVLLNYYVGDSLLTAIAISPTDFRVAVYSADKVSTAAAQFCERVRPITPAGLTTGPDAAWRHLAHALYKQLIGSLITGWTAESLVLIPHGSLSHLPWAALLTEPGVESAGWRTQPYLIERYALRIELSATTCWLQRQWPRTGDGDLYLGMAPSSSGTAPAVARGFRGEALASVFPGYFRQAGGPLPNSAKEIETVQQYFADPRVFKGAAADEGEFKRWAPRARYIHLAAHGFANTDHPSYSHLALARGTGAEDGLLYTDEIYNLPLQADLVVLSACGTGDGQYRSGSGVQSLARAFRAAGSREVLMSLWPIEDRTSFQLVTNFFRQLPNGTTATALRHAIREHLATVKADSYTHPYYWAGFAVQGAEPRPDLATGRWLDYIWWVAGIVLLLGIGRRIYAAQ